MPSPKISSIQVRRGKKSEWESANTTLLEGEIGYETNTYRVKIGRRNDNGQLIAWNDLKYQSPFSGFDKPVYPQEGDFWVEESTKNLYYFDGEEWKGVSSNPNFSGSINVENACFTGDLLPCADVTYNIGSSDNKWKDIHMGDTVSPTDFHINVGDSTDPDNIGGYYRLQLNGDDIAVRKDFEGITTQNLSLWRTTDLDGNLNPVPVSYRPFVMTNTRNLPPTNNVYNQATMNEWLFESLFNIVGRDTDPNVYTQQYWNTSQFEQTVKAQKGVATPITPETETDYNSPTTQSTYFHKADGSVSDRVPLNQSYWDDVTLMTRVRR